MATYGTGDFTNFRNVRVRGNVGDAGGDPGAIRFVATSAFESTMAVSSGAEGNYAYTLPAKNGGFGVTGTMAVQLGVIAASGYLETMVTVAGLRREDAFFAGVRDLGGTTVTVTSRSYPVLGGARPENGYVNLLFINPSTTATVFTDMVLGYTTFK